MNKKEAAELKRRFKKDHATFTRMTGCYVDGNRNKICTFGDKFLTLEEDEYYKYLEIAGKLFSGSMGNNMLNLEFPLQEEAVGGRQQILMALRDTNLEDETLLNTYYDLIIDTYDFAGNYLILLYLDTYDVMTKTRDNIDLDESEESFKYILCAICPVVLSKPALGYLENEGRIGSRIRDWVVGMPDTGFLFPAFNDRSTDIHSCLFYTKNTKEPHSEFMTNGLGCGVERTATEQKMTFHSIVRNVLGNDSEHTEDVLLEMQSNLNDMAADFQETHDEEDVFILDERVMTAIMEESKVPEDKAKRITSSLDEAFGSKMPEVENVIDTKALAANETRIEKRALENEVGELTLELNAAKKELEEKDQALSEKDQALSEKDLALSEKNQLLENYITGVSERTEETEEADRAATGSTYDINLQVKPEKAALIEEKIIDGRRYLLVPMEDDEQAAVNGEAL